MENDLFRGSLVRLGQAGHEAVGEGFARWNRSSEFARLLDSDPARLFSRKWHIDQEEKAANQEAGPAAGGFFFTIHPLDGEDLLGFVALFEIKWTSGDAIVAIALGEPQSWGKGLGTDAMRILLRYAFTELNLHRITLGVFGYNARAIRSYEKCGFKMEGCIRQAQRRDGQLWDNYFMGILRSEWEAGQAAQDHQGRQG